MKICVGLSGGVDSSVAALLLKRQGHDVFAMYMQNWKDTTGTLHGDCEWEEERFVAEMVARKLEIPFYFVDLSEEYRKRVVDYMFDEYSKGRTPNPDVMCNREIKFDAFLKVARKMGADMVATGHYCRKEEFCGPDGNPVYRILQGSDANKDQSYFLCRLTQEQLSKAVFPIGELSKQEVRRLAREADLPSADKKDSQGICFVGKVDLPTFLQQKLSSVEGDAVEILPAYYKGSELFQKQKALLSKGAPFTSDELSLLATPMNYADVSLETESYRSGRHHTKKTRFVENGLWKHAGRHEGAQFFTVGQRKGLGIGGHKEPVFVLSTDVERNLVFVGEGYRHPGLYRSALYIRAEEIHWIRPDLALSAGGSLPVSVRIRYRQPLQKACLYMQEDVMYIFFDQPQRGITPGQFAVWYSRLGDAGSQEYEMLGSGAIY
ncbi:MAG TPA: tRNA 2-thiouridine(34) synthase MnmA [Candidatus Cryptobacteroides sp.]|nr:tRNA 2-thiouridine(34) synthase MnmA [Candidatus Cryptobacteroides sp.]